MRIKAEILHQAGRVPGIEHIPGVKTTTPPQQLRTEVYRVERSKSPETVELPVVAREGQTIIFDSKKGLIAVG